MTSSPALRLAVDIGGTFTDTVLAGAAGKILASAKTATTPTDPTVGAAAGTERVLAQAGHHIGEVTGFVHGTTLATNALIERRGALVATVTTEGFRDILGIGYERRYSQYDINIDKPDLLVSRAHSFTVRERMSVAGEPLTDLDEASVDAVIEKLRAARIEAVAICLLHAYANPAHEERLRARILARIPDIAVSLSSEVSPEAREFDRLCTTIANAYVQPLMGSYLTDFETKFTAQGLTCPILMMTASGGMTTLETATRYPIRLVESGPAGGAILAAMTARRCGLPEILSFDMGGTTAKLCLIDNNRPQTTRAFEIARAARFIKGSGMPVRIPVMDMIEIGAGGGSIATVDRLGRILVGPQSAGSDPGPAAFGKGGQEATVTDADAVSGYLDPERFAEGRLSLDIQTAQLVLTRSVADELGLSAGQAAIGVNDIVDESMASAARMHAVESGKDLGQRTMIAFGGNGPLHATRVARRAGVSRILIPPDPGVGSAVGFLHAPVSFEVIRSLHMTLEDLDADRLNALFDGMAHEAEEIVLKGAPGAQLERRKTAFMRYRGQGHEIMITLPDRAFTAVDATAMQEAFEAEYSRQFSRAVPGMQIEVLNWGLTVQAIQTQPDNVLQPETMQHAALRRRTICCDLTGHLVEAVVVERSAMQQGDRLNGPALIVEPQTTTLVSADFCASVDPFGNLLLVALDAGEDLDD